MAVISFTEDNPNESWCVAGWAFRQVLDDVISQYPEDQEMTEEFNQSKTHSGLIIYLLEPEFAARVTRTIWQVATDILSGAMRSGIHDQPYGDVMTVEQYRESLRQLREAFPDSWNAEHNPEQKCQGAKQ
jgi:hypothetical protein